MKKNTILAIVLCSVILIGFYVVLPKFFPGIFGISKTPVKSGDTEISATEEKVIEQETDILSEKQTQTDLITAADFENTEPVVEEPEQFYTIKTDKVEVTFTNKGGDIVSYKLAGTDEKKKVIDKDTKEGVQISDSVSEANRTLAVAFGQAADNIYNVPMEVTKIDDKTIRFSKEVKIKKNGEVKTFTFGKQYSFKDNENLFKLDVLFHSNDDLSFLNKEDVAYTLRSAPQIGPHFDPKENRYENRQFLAYDGKKQKHKVLGKGDFKVWDKSKNEIEWVAIAGKYFTEIMIPAKKNTVSKTVYSSLVEKDNYANAQAFIERKAMSGTDVKDTYWMYFGPRNEKDLKIYKTTDTTEWGKDESFSGYILTPALQSSGWLSWLEIVLKFLLEWIYKVVRNWGVAIIVLTLLLRLALFPLSKNQSMGTLKMQEIQPRTQELQEKYKNDQQKLNMEMQKLYKEVGYNPMSGCLPLILQFLILFAMYNLFNYKYEFRGAMFSPHWIEDLSVGDSIWKLPITIPLLGWTHLRILPIVYTVTQLFYGKVTQYGGQTAQQQGQMSMKFMTYGMPIIFFFLFYNAPSGLLLYWTTSNLFQMGQQVIINKMMSKKKDEMKTKKIGNAEAQKTLPPKGKRTGSK